MIQEAIYTRLQAVAGLTALVGTRVYPRLMPQNPTYPAITYLLIASPRERAMGSDPGIVHSRWQFDVWDNDRDVVRDVTEQLRKALERYRGTFTDQQSQTQQWFDTFIDNVQEPGPELVDDKPVFRCIVDAIIHYSE